MSDEEKRAVRTIVDRAIAKGASLCVYDGEEYALMHSKDADEVMAALFACEIEWLEVWDAKGERRIGTIMFVYGNAPDEVVCDCTDKPEILEICGLEDF